jgi:hypothetical protein
MSRGHPESVAIVGNRGGTNVGESLYLAAKAAGYGTTFFNSYEAGETSRILRALAWRAARRPPLLNAFSAKVLDACRQARPDILISTGAAPLNAIALRSLRELGVRTVNYSTDDPWNPTMRARWQLRALPEYATVFTPRQANVADFTRIGCPDVRYLPFGFEPSLFDAPEAPLDEPGGPDVLLIGGADRDRADFVAAFHRRGPKMVLAGSYWERFAATRSYTIGRLSPAQVTAWTAKAKVNLCLVRRANRDGHVMRSLEIGAIGGCMLAEDTPEHRALFGGDAEAVIYFDDAWDAARKAKALIADPAQRQRLAAALHALICAGRHTYRDRLESILETARPSQGQAALARLDTAAR